MEYVDIQSEITGDIQKDHAIKSLVQSLNEISKSNQSLQRGLNGVSMLKLYAPTYHFVPFRDKDSVKNANERNKRDQYYKQQKWTQLTQHILYEQNKINKKRERRALRRKEKQLQNQQSDSLDQEMMNQLNQIQTDDLLKDQKILQSTSNDLNGDLLYNNYNKIRYGDYDETDDIKRRVKRAIKLCSEGRYKKADQALDAGIICDVDKERIWNITKSKFPQKPLIKQQNNNINKPTFKLTEDETLALFKQINPKSKGGKYGINNDVLLWAIEREEKYGLNKVVRKLAKEITENGLPTQISTILYQARGIPLSKEKNGIVDYDVRPIVIVDGILRVIDKLIINNINKQQRKAAIGPYQMIGQREACEIATIGCDTALDLLSHDENLCMLNLDASNAYNSIGRQSIYDLICDKVPDLRKYFETIYGNEIKVDFAHNRIIMMSSGCIQGLCSSELFYSALKWQIQQNVDNKMQSKYKEQYRMIYQCDYIDDGLNVLHYKYIHEYLTFIEQEYHQCHIKINRSKTCIIMNTSNELIKQYINHTVGEMDVNFSGNIKFLGVPHGQNSYINDQMHAMCTKLQKKLLHIQLINDSQIRNIMYTKFMSYNKIIYALKTTKILDQWFNKVNDIYLFIRKSLINHLNHHQTIQYQLPLTQKRGGFGLRSPDTYHFATRITAFSGKMDKIKILFGFDVDANNESFKNKDDIKYKQIYWDKVKRINEYIDGLYDKLNNFIGPQLIQKRNDNIKHKQILELIDKKYLCLFYDNSSIEDQARMKSISCNGASSWLTVVPNNKYGVKYTDREFYVLLSLYLGSNINNKQIICGKCDRIVDCKGYHSLHCGYGSNRNHRHNALRDELNGLFKSAGYNTKIEQKYNWNANNNEYERVDGIPGDIWVEKWSDDNKHDTYFDVTVSNVFAATYIKKAAETRLYTATLRETEKIKKYNNNQSVIPLAVETMGALGNKFKNILQKLAERISLRKNQPYNVTMNRIRTKIISILMKENAKMMLSSITM